MPVSQPNLPATRSTSRARRRLRTHPDSAMRITRTSITKTTNTMMSIRMKRSTPRMLNILKKSIQTKKRWPMSLTTQMRAPGRMRQKSDC